MACLLKNGVNISGLNEGIFMSSKTKRVLGFSASSDVLHTGDYSKSRKEFPVLSSEFNGKTLTLSDHEKGFRDLTIKAPSNFRVNAQASICVSKARRWWERTLTPNMVEIHSAQELAETLANAGDRLVIIDFYSPGCGGCRTLHPKICQLAELNPNAIFLKVNYEELRSMCHGLHIHVLPFFRFYRGAEGRLSSFSCTIATIKKFKDALAKHSADRCSLGRAKGLDESEILKLSSMGELSVNLPLVPSNSSNREERLRDLIAEGIDDLPSVWSLPGSNNKMMMMMMDHLKEDNNMTLF